MKTITMMVLAASESMLQALLCLQRKITEYYPCQWYQQ